MSPFVNSIWPIKRDLLLKQIAAVVIIGLRGKLQQPVLNKMIKCILA